jgi:hypothetical protein
VRTELSAESLALPSAPPKELRGLLPAPASIAAIRFASACISEFNGGRSVDAEQDDNVVAETRSADSSNVVRPATQNGSLGHSFSILWISNLAAIHDLLLVYSVHNHSRR